VSSESFAGFVRESLEVLRREVPVAHAAMCAPVAGRLVAIGADGEELALRFAADGVRAAAPGGVPDLSVRTSRDAVLALVDAECSLLEAVLSDRLVLRGTPDDVIAFHDALVAYLHGAVRAPSFPGLLRRFRAHAHGGMH
jgi:hypothetical protein